MPKKIPLKVDMILHTKDGRRIGNAIIANKLPNDQWRLITDYGSVSALSENEIRDFFYIAYSEYTKQTHGMSFEEAQELTSTTHKYSSKNPDKGEFLYYGDLHSVRYVEPKNKKQ